VLSSLLAYLPYLTWMRPPLPLVAAALVLNTAAVVFWLVRDAAAQRRATSGGERGTAPSPAPPEGIERTA